MLLNKVLPMIQIPLKRRGFADLINEYKLYYNSTVSQRQPYMSRVAVMTGSPRF
jgi:hypothetical protein